MRGRLADQAASDKNSRMLMHYALGSGAGAAPAISPAAFAA